MLGRLTRQRQGPLVAGAPTNNVEHWPRGSARARHKEQVQPHGLVGGVGGRPSTRPRSLRPAIPGTSAALVLGRRDQVPLLGLA
eukprot:12039532-Alexandrium_andersonii.AAC.1